MAFALLFCNQTSFIDKVFSPNAASFSARRAGFVPHAKTMVGWPWFRPRREGEPDHKEDVAALPKGNIDAGEKPAEAALREVREETGLIATLVAKLGDIKYVYVRKWAGNEKVFKVVSFFLTKYQSGQIIEA